MLTFNKNYLKVVFKLVPVTTYERKLKIRMQITFERRGEVSTTYGT